MWRVIIELIEKEFILQFVIIVIKGDKSKQVTLKMEAEQILLASMMIKNL